mgnify:CR=1 FL=1
MITEVSKDIFLVDLPQKKEGFRNFISSWVVRDGEKALIVDVGPTSTIKKLVDYLKYLKIKKVEYILTTHIHIDHAGGLAEFLKYYDTKVVLHEKAEKHLLNTEKLWEGTKKVLGDLAEIYGKIDPIPEDAIYRDKVEFGGYEIDIIKTPGHAVHHQSYLFDDYLFAGEAIGVHQPLKKDYYLRPATPPKFVYDIAYKSIKKLEKLGNKIVCFGHYGFEPKSLEIIDLFKEQLKLWIKVVSENASQYEKDDEIIRASKTELLRKDKMFSKYKMLDDDIKKREDYFIENSLRGILGWVKG